VKTSKIKEIKLIFLLAIALVIFISLFTFKPQDIRFLTSSPNPAKDNVVGFVGAYLAYALRFLMGSGAYIIPVFISFLGIMSLAEEREQKNIFRIIGAAFLFLAVSSILSMTGSTDLVYRFGRGGIIGLLFSDFLLKYLGAAGAIIAIAVLLLLSIIVTTDFLIFSFISWLASALKSLLKKTKSGLSDKIKPKAFTKIRPATDILPRKIPEIKISQEPRIAQKLNSARPEPKVAEKPKEKKPALYDKPYEFPPLDLLDSPPPVEEREIKEDLNENSRILEDTLRDFGIETKVVEVNKGPVITRYELQPASGVRVDRITSLSDNIALTMKSVNVRVVAPIPGKGTVGVEVPNLKGTLVYLKEILQSKEFKKTSSKLKLALGKEISGKPIIADLDKMPHLLIAGATGSGKTVCLNGVITALLYNAAPEDLKFLMIDPKRVELAYFDNLPHLVAPVVKDAKKAAHALEWVTGEMDKRFDMFAAASVRNIEGYNAIQKSEKLPKLPYIIVVIDELHDLMLVAQQDVESIITRIAQLSRAVGIHMIIATQRPSVDVITGVIKANLPARISFKVASKVDSRTVIDMNGAEKLLGMGDMLFIEPGNPKPVRAQGSLVSDEEILRVTEFIKSQRKPDFVDDILKVDEKTQYKRFEKDEVYDEAVRLVIQTKQASVSMLQRRLGVGYTRAARLIDMMEDSGVVGSYQGSKPREILIEKIEDLA